MGVELALAVPEDFVELAKISPHTPPVPPMRMLAIAAKLDGRVIGIGGIAFYKNGQNVGFVDMTEEARKYPVAIHKAGVAAIALAKKHGVKQLVARGESHAASQRWLIRLGFEPVLTAYGVNYVLDL